MFVTRVVPIRTAMKKVVSGISQSGTSAAYGCSTPVYGAVLSFDDIWTAGRARDSERHINERTERFMPIVFPLAYHPALDRYCSDAAGCAD
jgi:hypothetical protein